MAVPRQIGMLANESLLADEAGIEVGVAFDPSVKGGCRLAVMRLLHFFMEGRGAMKVCSDKRGGPRSFRVDASQSLG